jgi:ribonuclease BN (tRNA processing enzyme)
MKAVLWGTRGSLGSASAETVMYGGDTSSVELVTSKGTILVLDAGSGVRRLGSAVPENVTRVDLLLTHLHMDHIQGLGFFGPMYNPNIEAHVWGPASSSESLRTRLSRYLSPPLFPVCVRDLPNVYFHDVMPGSFEIADATISADFICHPDPTLGYRIEADGASLAYMPDHEPALGSQLPYQPDPEWTSGYSIARGVDVLIHDAQYTEAEYLTHIGWGHSSMRQTTAFATLAEVGQLVSFHHDPSHSDSMLEEIAQKISADEDLSFKFFPGKEGVEFHVGKCC